MAARHLGVVVEQLRRLTAKAQENTVSDDQLLERFVQERSDAAFQTLVGRYGPMVLGVCRRVLYQAEDVEDAFQATFLVLARKAASVGRRGPLRNWLYGVAYRTAAHAKVDAAKRRAREAQVPARAPPDPLAEITVRELLAVLDAELVQLPAQYQRPLLLCYLEGKTRDEAAAELGWSLATLGRRLERGRELLRVRLERQGLGLAVALATALLIQGGARAAVPIALSVSTIKAATQVAAGSAVSTAVSAKVAALTEGVLKAMLLSKLKVATAVLLACLAIGGTFLTFRAAAADREGTQPAAGKDAPAGIAAAQEPKLAGPPVGDVVNTKDDMVTAAAFATDSQLLAAGGMDKKVRLWDMLTSKPKQTLEGAKGIVRTVAFSPDSKSLAAGADDSGIYLWEVATGKLQAELQTKLPRKAGTPVFVNGLVFLPGGKLAAVYNYHHNEQDTRFARIVVWDIAKKNAEMLFEERGTSYSLAPSPDGKLLAATMQGDSNGFKVWDLDSSKVIWEEQAGPDFMSAVVFARDGTKLAVGGGHMLETGQGWLTEGRLWLFDVKARKLLWNVKEAANGCYNHLSFTADGKGVLTGSSGPSRKYRIRGNTATKVVSELRRWDSATGKMVWKTEGELGGFNAVTVSADGKTVAGSDAAHFMVFDPETGALREVLAKVQH